MDFMDGVQSQSQSHSCFFLKNGKEIKSQSDCKRNGGFNDPQRGDVAKPANTLELIK